MVLDLLDYATKKSQTERSITQLQSDSAQFQSTMAEKLAKLEEKIDGQDARIASKVFTWLALALGALVSAFTLGTLTGPMAMIAGAIGMAVAVYSLAQQVATEATDGAYVVGQEWVMMLEACGVSEEEAQRIGPILNGVIMATLSLVGGGMGVYAAFKAGAGAATRFAGDWGVKLAKIGYGGEVASTVADMGTGASGIAVSSIDLENGLTDAEVQLLDAALKQIGITRDQLVQFIQQMMENLEQLTSAVLAIMDNWKQTNHLLAQARPPSMM